MPMINYNDLAKKYFSGRINADEESELYAWVREDESHLDQLHAWEDEWKESEENSQDVNWERMLGRIAAREVLEGGDFRTTKKPVRWWPYAAAAVMAIGILLRVALPHGSQQIYAMEAPVGEKCRVFLPDSTVVWLNSDSRLSFDESFNHKVRNVKLVGEGYFEVAHNENKPFSVICGDVSVLVRGTKFNVSAYPEDRFVSASVVEGHVSFINEDAHLELYKGQSAQYDLLAGAFSRSLENPEDAAAWTQSRFRYDDITLRELSVKLSRTYAVRFHFNTTEHLDQRFNISLRNNETLPEVLQALEFIIPVKARIEGDNVYIDKQQ